MMETPTVIPGVKKWNEHVFALVSLVQANLGFWPADMALKYITIKIDTRDGRFLLMDRDGNLIPPTRIQEAIDKWKMTTTSRSKIMQNEQEGKLIQHNPIEMNGKIGLNPKNGKKT